MEKKQVTKHFLKDYTPFLFNEGSESFLFKNEEYILKFIKKEFLNKDRENTILRLNDLNLDSIVKPEFILYDKKGFLGYGMKYYKSYQQLYNLITNNIFSENETFPFIKRKQIALKVYEIIDNLLNNNFAYFDIHDKNILIDNTFDIKLIDLDSGVFKDNMYFHEYYIRASKQLALFTLSLIYNLHLGNDFTCFYKNKSKLFDYLPEKLRKYYSYVLYDDIYVFNDAHESIQEINETIYEDTLQILKLANKNQ